MKFVPLLCFLFSYYIIYAQTDCYGDKSGFVFQANRIGAFYSPSGAKHWDFDNGFFKVPYTSEKSPSTIFASSPWIGGLVNNQLRLSGQTYSSPERDLFMGPLSPGGIQYANCGQFNQVWSVSRSEIMQHIHDFELDGIIQDPIPNVFGWPGQGNIFFQDIHGFNLPTNHEGGWASFADLNQNSIYEPQLGEYPQVVLKGKPVIPEAIAWMVFNDAGTHQVALTDPLGVEIQLTVFGFSCEDNPVLNSTLFNTYKIINQGVQAIDSTHFGIWTDYDLGCAEDDFVGSDSTRSTEFVYNDEEDGDVGFECSTGQATYGDYPPVQSMTYLSPRMNSFTIVQRPFGNEMWPTFHNAQEQYHLLAGTWADGTPIRISGNGYDVEPDKAITKYLFNGDPRDPEQWSWWQEGFDGFDPHTISSAYLGSIQPGASSIVETAYTFHQDSSFNHLGQFGPMYANLDSLLKQVDDISAHCQLTQICTDKDCVWPGDFNHDGIADHYDMLHWGVMKDQAGTKRNGLINWAGHYADSWDLTLPDNVNAKHGDGDGNGVIAYDDIERNLVHYLNTNPSYIKQDSFPEGPEIVMVSDAMSSNGLIRNLRIEMGQTVENVLGLAYQVDIDTSLYHFESVFNIIRCPADSDIICIDQGNGYDPGLTSTVDLPRFMFVKTDHEAITLEEGLELHRLFNGIKLRPGKTLDDVPDTVTIRLKNLIALDANGNNLHIGSRTLKVPKYLVPPFGEGCPWNRQAVIYQANRIGAVFSSQGTIFEGGDGYFKAPYTSEQSPSTMYASAPWLSALRNDTLRLAAQTYSNSNKHDYYVGPLNENGKPYLDHCEVFSKIFIVHKSDIEEHLQDYNDNGQVDKPNPNVFGWPAQGNIHFINYHGIELPSDHRGGWADFMDLNKDGIYQPDEGEYPAVEVEGVKHIPDEILWNVFNDHGTHTQSRAHQLGVEIQLTAYAFNCANEPVLNNTIFNAYKIINAQPDSLKDLYFGMWTDYDLGCPNDDYLGSDSLRNTEFAYNSDSFDGDDPFGCQTDGLAYANYPPLQSRTYLSHPMNSFALAQDGLYTPVNFDNMLKGLWFDGEPITVNGDGYNPGSAYPVTKYYFHGDIRDTTQWSAASEQISPIEIRSISSVFVGDLEPYTSQQVTMAYIFSQDSSLNHLEQYGFMQEQVDSLVSLLPKLETSCVSFPVCYEPDDCVWPGDYNHNGIANFYDYLYWGVMYGSAGPGRDGNILWKSQYAEPWSNTIEPLLNYKHGDANGDGTIDSFDLERHLKHNLFTRPDYVQSDEFPVGPHLKITAEGIDSTGAIKNLKVVTNESFTNVYGMAFELEFDTSLLKLAGLGSISVPADTGIVSFNDDGYLFGRYQALVEQPQYGFVKMDGLEVDYEQGKTLRQFLRIQPKSGVTFDDLPDTIEFRLKNLIAIDKNGHDLQIGSEPLYLLKSLATSIEDVSEDHVTYYPNPVHDKLYIVSSTKERVTVFNLLGVPVLELPEDQPGIEIDVRMLQPGVYYGFLHKSGKAIRFVKQ